jgi:tRNA threonylcarbamoyladenosine biosynthesis protein TsaB
MPSNKKNIKKEVVLAVETSGKALSAAVSVNGKLVSQESVDTGLAHSEKIVAAVSRVLKKAGFEKNEITKIASSTGPGSFTGIRVGLSFARMTAQVLELTPVGVNTLDILREGAPKGDHYIYPMIDALRNEVYAFDSKSGKPEIQNLEKVVKKIKSIKGDVLIVGSGAKLHSQYLRKMIGSRLLRAHDKYNIPQAGVLAVMANRIKGKNFNKVVPLYIRRSWAEERVGV